MTLQSEALKSAINIEGANVWKDYFKNTIRLGDLVLYPNRAGSSLWMNHGTVLARGTTEGKPSLIIKKVQTNYLGRFLGHREVTVYCLDRVIALGRGHGDFGFQPRKAKIHSHPMPSLIDRIMAWFRGRDNQEMQKCLR